MKTFPKTLEARLKIIRRAFIAYLSQTFIARCQWLQVFIDPKTTEIFVNINTLLPNPDMSPEAIPLPPISLREDFECLKDFVTEHADKIDPDRLLSHDVFAEVYLALMEKRLLDEYKDFREKSYLKSFKIWATTFGEKIKKMDFR